MSYITLDDPINPVAYCIDNLDVSVSGVIASRYTSFVNLSRASKVMGITVGGEEPSGSHRYFAFRLGTAWGSLTASGQFQAFEENSATFTNLQQNGNSASDLAGLTSAPALAGRSFAVAIALSAEDHQSSFPTASLRFKCLNETRELNATETSPVYDLGTNAQLIAFEGSNSYGAGGNVTVYAQIRNPDGTLSKWQTPASFNGKKARTVQFQADYSASTPGMSYAKVDNASFTYTRGAAYVPGTSGGEIITKTLDWYMPIRSCRLTVYHSEIVTSTIKGFVAFRDAPAYATNERLGIGTGAKKTFQLAHPKAVRYDSFILYYDGARSFAGFELDTEIGRVTCTAPEGAVVSCDYSYNWDMETWREIPLVARSFTNDGYKSEYRLTIPDNSKTAACVKIKLSQVTGHTLDEILGRGVGSAKSYKLAHILNGDSITVKANGVALSPKNYHSLEDPQYVSIAAANGASLTATYDWVSEAPKISLFHVVFSE